MLFTNSRLLSVYKPAASRRHKRNTTRHNSRTKYDERPRLGKLNAAEPLLNLIRQRLPAEWQYGARWTFVTRVWNAGILGFTGYLIYYFFYRATQTEIDEMAQMYTYIRDDQGKVVDSGYKPIIDSAKHARKRVSRMMEDIEEEHQQQKQQQEELEKGQVVSENQNKNDLIQEDGNDKHSVSNESKQNDRTSEVKR